MAASFEDILLEEEQQRLLIALVEASRKQPLERRQRFLRSRSFEMDEITGLGDYGKVYLPDIDTLLGAGLLHNSSSHFGSLLLSITPTGNRYYDYLMQSRGTSVERIEETIFSYLDATAFEKRRPQAYDKWKQAEELLWSSDSKQQHSAIGHHCREAMQFFATSLVEQHQPPDVEKKPDLTVKRMSAVLEQHSDKLSDSVGEILKAMLNYWAKLNDLIQRQEHGAQKEGEALTWEDSRRLVFQTAIVMFEIDRTLRDLK